MTANKHTKVAKKIRLLYISVIRIFKILVTNILYIII